MRKSALSSLLPVLILCFTLNAQAQETKTIILNDGTTIKGVVKSLNNGSYTIETTNLGTVQLQENKVVTITTGSPAPSTGMNATAGLGGMMQDPQMAGQINMLQSTIMSDPALMQEIQTLINNPNVLKALNDQQFLDDVMSYDPDRIQNNPQTQKLLNDPEVMRLMELMGQKFGAGQVTP